MSSKLASLAAYVPLQAALLPAGLAGMAASSYLQRTISRRLGVSQTAVLVLSGRYAMHRFGIRADAAAEKLFRALPNSFSAGLDVALFPLWVKHQISDDYFLYPRVVTEGRENFSDLIVARTLYIDRMIDRLADAAEQFVILGAGFDTRAYGTLQHRGVKIFELDKASTQTLKRQSLERSDVATGHVRYVSIDFRVDDLFETLAAAGYTSTKKTIFLWEGVSLYLTEPDARKLLSAVNQHAAPGSTIIADFYARRFLAFGKVGSLRRLLDATNEAFEFGLDFAPSTHEDTMTSFVRSVGLSPGDGYFLGGASGFGPFAAVAELRVTT